MRFFEQQDAARAESLRLVLLFAGASLATVAGVHLAFLVGAFISLALIPVSLFVQRPEPQPGAPGFAGH